MPRACELQRRLVVSAHQRLGARLRALLVVGALFTAGGCEGPAAELRIDLVRGEGATLSGMNALRFLVRDLAADAPEVYGPIALDEGDRRFRLSATVTPGSEFYVDVLGCADATGCEGDAYLARGCTAVLVIETDTTVDVALFDRAQPEAAACPPQRR